MAKVVIGSNEDPLVQIWQSKKSQEKADQEFRLEVAKLEREGNIKLSELRRKGLSWNKSEG